MSNLEIVPISIEKHIKQFIDFPFELYKHDTYWVPQLKSFLKHQLSKTKNPFFEHADMQLFLAKQDNKVVGRIAAIKNDLHNKIHNDNVGFFGFFEAINEQEVANKLFDSAKNWLYERKFEIMRGPASPSSNDEYGLLIDGFNDMPRLGMSYNPQYYQSLFENYGLKKAKDLYAYKIESQQLLASEKLVRGVELVKQRAGVTIRSIDLKNFKAELEKFKYVYNKAWAINWGFVPLTDKEIDAIAKDYKPIIDPDLVLFMEKNGEIIGSAFTMPDYNQIFKNMNGKLFPFGIFKLLTQKKNIKWARILTLGLIPEYRKKGLDSLFYYEIVKRAMNRNIHLGEASWVLEDNEMMNRGAKQMNGTLYKTYRIFDYPI